MPVEKKLDIMNDLFEFAKEISTSNKDYESKNLARKGSRRAGKI